MVGLSEDKLLVLERISTSTKLYVISLANAENILGTVWDDIAKKKRLWSKSKKNRHKACKQNDRI